MHIPRIYITQTLCENTTIDLAPDSAHHIAKVLRMGSGQSVVLFNGELNHGKAGEFEATLAYVDKKNVCVAVGRFIPKLVESPLTIELGVCLIKNDKMDWLLQKATELGVSRIVPLRSEYTDLKIPADRLDKKVHHWQRITINACEQSARVAVPLVSAPQKIDQWLSQVQADKKWVLHPSNSPLKQDNHTIKSLALLVGPEGGLTHQEVALACDHGFSALGLGPRILRAETAPLAALSLLQHHYGDL